MTETEAITSISSFEGHDFTSESSSTVLVLSKSFDDGFLFVQESRGGANILGKLSIGSSAYIVSHDGLVSKVSSGYIPKVVGSSSVVEARETIKL